MIEVVGLHHVAFAHAPGEAIHEYLEDLLGLKVVHREEGDGFVERMLRVGSGYLQTLEATGPGVVQRFVQRRGSALHHVAVEVADLPRALEDLRRAGARLVDRTARPGGMGTTISFVHPATFGGLLVELVQAP